VTVVAENTSGAPRTASAVKLHGLSNFASDNIAAIQSLARRKNLTVNNGCDLCKSVLESRNVFYVVTDGNLFIPTVKRRTATFRAVITAMFY